MVMSEPPVLLSKYINALTINRMHRGASLLSEDITIGAL